MNRKSSKHTQSLPDLDPHLKFRMGLALMGEENARLFLVWLQAAREKRLREEAALAQTASRVEAAS